MLAERYGDWSSVAGFIVGLIGLAITIWVLVRAGTIKEAVDDATRHATNDTKRVLTIIDVGSAINITREITHSLRDKKWMSVTDLSTRLRAHLVRLRAENPRLTADQKTIIQSFIAQVATLQEATERALAGEAPPDVPKSNKILMEQADYLESVSMSLRFKENPI
jgi:hypothetical protein